jgi:hypothetical protein
LPTIVVKATSPYAAFENDVSFANVVFDASGEARMGGSASAV